MIFFYLKNILFFDRLLQNPLFIRHFVTRHYLISQLVVMVSNGMDFYKGQNSKLIENEFRSCSNCIQKISGHKNPISENQSITTFIQHSKY